MIYMKLCKTILTWKCLKIIKYLIEPFPTLNQMKLDLVNSQQIDLLFSTVISTFFCFSYTVQYSIYTFYVYHC